MVLLRSSLGSRLDGAEVAQDQLVGTRFRNAHHRRITGGGEKLPIAGSIWDHLLSASALLSRLKIWATANLRSQTTEPGICSNS